MSKFKSKKLSKSSIAIILLSFALISLLAFGATFALFTASTSQIQSSGVKTGQITLTKSGTYTMASTRVFPGQKVLTGTVNVAPETGVAADTAGQYVAVKISAEVKKNGAADYEEIPGLLTIGWNTTSAKWAPTTIDDVYVFVPTSQDIVITEQNTLQTIVAGSAGTMTAQTLVLTDITFDAFDHYLEGNANSRSDKQYMDADIRITIDFRSVQVSANTGKTVSDIATYLFGTASSANGGNYNNNVTNEAAN